MSTGQEMKEKPSFTMFNEMEGAALACASIQAQNAHFLPTTTTITQLMKMTMETSEEVSTGQDIKGTSIIIRIK